MWDRLKVLEERFRELDRKIADPEVMRRREEWSGLLKEHRRLAELVELVEDYRRTEKEISDTAELLKETADEELRELATGELELLRQKKDRMERELYRWLIPRDPMDEKGVIMEIRAGAGGEEAALFAADLFRMYTKYAERKGWKYELMGSHPTDMGGFKEIAFALSGEGAYSRLKFESGVHRVQRIPVTESGGRIHTSTATVAVLPEADEVEVEIDPDELVIETFCASGPGGQHVNKTESAVRITHIPTGVVVSCQDEKSQHKNRERAMRVLRARLLKLAQEAQHREVAEMRRSQVGTGDRSERIRTYNFPQTRVTDHRIGLTLHKLDAVLEGDLDEIIDALAAAEEESQLKAIGS